MNYLTHIILVGGILMIGSCAENKTQSPQQYLKIVLSHLEEIKSATYYAREELWSPGDSIPTKVLQKYYKAYDNPSDTSLGASWVQLNSQDTTQLEYAYDGNMRILLFEEDKRLEIDSFKVKKLPFRPIGVPFYQNTQDILEYALSTEDSITLDFDDLGDTLYVKLSIHEDTQVEFFGKATHLPEPPPGWVNDPTSQYELWIAKSTHLPYKYRRSMEHNISVETVEHAQFNTEDIKGFVAASYFPADYEISKYGEERKVSSPHELLGKTAPDWLLTNEHGEKLGLDDFESKVVLVQFTSVNCGPCRASIPFLNRLSRAYQQEDFELVAIESFTSNTNVLAKYRQRTGLDYQFLMSEDEVNQQYHIRATPIFFLLDEKRIVKKVFSGYGGDATEKEITESIHQLI